MFGRHFARENTTDANRCGLVNQGREEEADKYRERVEAIEGILSEYDKQEQERVAGLRQSHAGVDWRSPSEAMRKVGPCEMDA